MAKILLVDDDIDIRKIVRMRLEAEKHSITEATSAREALAFAKAQKPDAIILDLGLPDRDGLEVLRDLRALPATASKPILIFSSRTQLSAIEGAFDAGANDYIVKPFKGDSLAKKLAALLAGGGVHGKTPDKPFGDDAVLTPACARVAAKHHPLGDVAEIFTGIVTGDNKHFLADARRGPTWQPIILERSVQPFHLAYGNEHVRFEPQKLMHVPQESLFRQNKVVLKRSAPPLVAAVDRNGFLAEMCVYSIVPAKGLLPEYVAAMLNGRFYDYFLRRFHPIPAGKGSLSLLRETDVQGLPMPVPSLAAQNTVATLVRELERVLLELSTPITKMRTRKTLESLNLLLFTHLGITQAEITRLTELHF